MYNCDSYRPSFLFLFRRSMYNCDSYRPSFLFLFRRSMYNCDSYRPSFLFLLRRSMYNCDSYRPSFLFLLRRSMYNCDSYRPSFIITMKIHGCDVTGCFLIKRGCYTRHMSLFSDEKLLTLRLPPELQTHTLWSLSMAFSWPPSKSRFLLSQSIEASCSVIRGQI